MFTRAILSNVEFLRSSLICNSFEDAELERCMFVSCSTAGTHFLQAKVENSGMHMCHLKETVFFDTLKDFKIDPDTLQTAQVTRPITVILVSAESRGVSTPKAFMKLDQEAHAIPLRIALKNQKVIKENVNQEVERALADIGPCHADQPPIPQRLIKTILEDPGNHANARHILEKAEKLSAEVDSFFLPGGEDVPPALYGATVEETSDWGGDYRRSILELGMIHYSVNKGIPLMGVCRGFQMSNVYFGAQLVQHVQRQLNCAQKFTLDNQASAGLLNTILKGTIVGAVAHHQAIQKDKGEATEYLEGLLTFDGLVKASQPKEGGVAPMILLQFHPEFYGAPSADSTQRQMVDFPMQIVLSEKNDDFWKVLSNSRRTD